MTLLWIEGFEGFGTTTGSAPSPTGVVGRKYALVGLENSMTVEAGRLSGYALKLGYDSTCYLQPAPLTTNATMVVGFAVKFTSFYAAPFLSFFDDTTRGMTLRLTAAGEIAVYRGSTLLATTSGLGIQTNTWAYLEFKVVCGESGSYELRVNGQNVLSASGVDTREGSNNYHTTFRVQGLITLSAYRMTVDDLYCVDGSGSTNNDFLGPRRVVAILPDAAGDSAQFTPDSGDNYARVNGQVADDDTSYVESSTTGHKDLYNYGALSGITGGINGVQVNTMARDTDATPFSVKTVCKSGSTESEDTAQTIGSTDYVTKRRILETDPNTSAAWTPSGVNGAQFGAKVG